MNAGSIDIKEMLEAETELGLVFSSNLFIGREPAEPHNVVTIYDSNTAPPHTTFDGSVYNYDTVQIRVRNKKYLDGYVLCQAIRDSLHGRAQETWGGTLYSSILCTSGPATLGWDDNNRVMFSINFQLQRR